ncbi:hypothetical protein ABPG77_007519 [Micractinium sp. CCAP 211/92]
MGWGADPHRAAPLTPARLVLRAAHRALKHQCMNCWQRCLRPPRVTLRILLLDSLPILLFFGACCVPGFVTLVPPAPSPAGATRAPLPDPLAPRGSNSSSAESCSI